VPRWRSSTFIKLARMSGVEPQCRDPGPHRRVEAHTLLAQAGKRTMRSSQESLKILLRMVRARLPHAFAEAGDPDDRSRLRTPYD
jgi:hypothetical protein